MASSNSHSLQAVHGLAANKSSLTNFNLFLPYCTYGNDPHIALMDYDFCSDPILKPAYDYWRSKCGTRAMPMRRDIDATEISPALLPYLQITELVDGGRRVRYRLTGTAIVDAFGAELRGKYFDELYSGERLRFVAGVYRRICDDKKPLLVCNRYDSKRNVELISIRLILPLSDDGININQCLSAVSFKFPGDAHQWFGQWFGNSDDFNLSKFYIEVVS